MTRYTSAYSLFLSRLDEVTLLIRSAKKKEREDPVGARNEINALCRGSLVLLSSHVEAYIKEVGELALDAFQSKSVDRSKLSTTIFYHISKDFIEDIRGIADQERLAERVFDFLNTDAPLWSKNGPFSVQIPAEKFNKGFSNPTFDKVKAYFSRFGYNKYRLDFNRKLRADALVTENMLNHLVNVRNSIAHGDQSVTKTPGDIKEMIDIVVRFCRVTDDIFSKWCRENYCSIR